MTKEEAQALYEGKFFYEIKTAVVGSDGNTHLTLIGPSEDIRFVTTTSPELAFVKINGGNVVQAYAKNAILITDRKLA